MSQCANRVDPSHLSGQASVASQFLEFCVQLQLDLIRGSDPAECLTDALLTLLDVTGSECGFVGALKGTLPGAAHLIMVVESELAWSDATGMPERRSLLTRREIHDHQSLPVQVLIEARPVIVNDVAIPLRAAVCSNDSVAVKSFLGIPLTEGDEIVGVVGLANRLDGYDASVLTSLDRLIETTSAILVANQRRQLADIALPLATERAASAHTDPCRPVAGAESIKSTEPLWTTLVENMPDYVMLIDRDGRLKFLNHVNPGYDTQPILETTIFDYQPEQVHEVVRDALQRVFENGESVTYETQGEGSPGKPCHYECRLIRLHDGTTVETAMLIATDVTARKHAEAADAEHVSLLNAVASGTTELIFVKDRDSCLCFVNDAVAIIHNTTAERIVGKRDSDFYPPDTAARMINDDRRVMDNDVSITVEEVVPLATGARIYVTTKTPWRNADGEIVGILGISQDVTKLKSAELKLNRSEHFLRTITDASPLIIYVFDLTSQSNVYSNRKIAVDLGYSPTEIHELGGSFFLTLLHPDDMQRVPDLLQRWDTASDGEIFEQEYRMRHADGSWRWFLGRDTVFSRSDDGAVEQIIGTAQDITERVVTQLALRSSEERLRAILELGPECVKLVSRDGLILEMNQAGLRLLEAGSKQEVINACVFPMVAPEYRDEFIDLHRRVCNGESGMLEMEIVGFKGTRRRLVTQAVPVQIGPEGEFAHLAVTRDVTAEREAEAIIAQQRSQLARFSRLSIMGQMTAAITHEITQPLTSVSFFSSACEVLLSESAPDLERLRKFVQSILHQSERASEILKRIRGFVCGAPSPRQRTLLSAVIHESIELLRPELRSRRVQLECHDSIVDPWVWVDRVQIQQVIVNVLTNACDALTTVSESERRIIISTSVIDNFVVTDITDSGPGLSDEVVEHLFDPFITSKQMGMGMGLAICLDIIKAHKGDIEASNSPDGGAVFRFRLPRHTEVETAP